MKQQNVIHGKRVLVWMMATVLIGLTACSPKTPVSSSSTSSDSSPSSSANNYLAELQLNNLLDVSLYGLMTFQHGVTTFSYPSEIAVQSIPITWMGTSFTGELEEIGPGEEVTDQVHGTASSDGLWLDSLFYSREIVRRGSNNRILYRVTLRTIPIGEAVNGTLAGFGTFEKSGADVQKYIVKIEYTDGPLDTSQPPVGYYLSTDWKTTVRGQLPLLKVKFGQGTPTPKLGPGM